MIFLEDTVVVWAKMCGGSFVDDFVVGEVVAAFSSPWEALSHSTVTLGTFGGGPPFSTFLFPVVIVFVIVVVIVVVVAVIIYVIFVAVYSCGAGVEIPLSLGTSLVTGVVTLP